MKTAYLVAAVGVVAVVGIVGWLTLGSPEVAIEEQSQTYTDDASGVTPTTDPQLLTGQDTFTNLLALGRTLECSFVFKDSTVGSVGTGFFDGKNIRVDSMYTVADGGVYTSNMISDGAILYVWSQTEAGQFAVKMAVPAATASSATVPAQNGQMNMEEKVQYSCKPWNVDGSVFVPPADISFIDMNDVMKGLPQMGR